MIAVNFKELAAGLYSPHYSFVWGITVDQWFAMAQGGELVGLYDSSRHRAYEQPLLDGAIYEVGEQVSMFAPPDSALHQVLLVFQKMQLNPGHPAECYEEAERWMQATGLDDPALQNLEHLPFVTIDNPDSRDLDQAIFLQLTDDGSRVLYALADAAYYVRPGSALFDCALSRGVTYYAPGFAAPMLPPALSEGLISLNPDVPRRALVFDISLDGQGNSLSTTVYQARIRSRAKLSYQGVQAWFDQRGSGATHRWDGLDYGDSLGLLEVIGEQRIALARERHVVEHNRREAQMSIDPDQPSNFRLQMRDRNDVERYNEQISLLCNMEGAQLLLRHQKLSDEMQAVFRVHLPPMHSRLKSLRESIDALCDLHQLGGPWRWDGKCALAAYLEGLPWDRPRLRQAIERQIMLINHASEFSADPGPHHALGVDGYARFSSPMREIAGVFTHKELLEVQGAIEPRAQAEDQRLRAQVIDAANLAKKTQRKLEKSFQLHIVEQFLRDDLALPLGDRPVRGATVMGMRGSRIYLAVDGFSLDIKLYAEDLQHHWKCSYKLTETTALADDSSAPSLRIGDAARLRTQRWDEKRSRFVLELVVD